MAEAAKRRSLRPARADDLGLRRALSDRLLPLLVAAMSFLAALALGGAEAASLLAQHWRGGAAALVTVQVPRPLEPAGGMTRQDAVAARLAATPWIADTHRLSAEETEDLVSPWLGADVRHLALRLPGVFELHLTANPPDTATLAAQLQAAAPGTLLERNGVWASRLARLAGRLRQCAILVLGIVAGTAAAVVAITTRAGLAACREAIEIVHGLGATDRLIAARFARRLSGLTAGGAAIGLVPAIPVLLGLAMLGATLTGAAPEAGPRGPLAALPLPLWIALPLLPPLAGIVAWATASLTVRAWLRSLP